VKYLSSSVPMLLLAAVPGLGRPPRPVRAEGRPWPKERATFWLIAVPLASASDTN
jgi:hypothetical protein